MSMTAATCASGISAPGAPFTRSIPSISSTFSGGACMRWAAALTSFSATRVLAPRMAPVSATPRRLPPGPKCGGAESVSRETTRTSSRFTPK